MSDPSPRVVVEGHLEQPTGASAEEPGGGSPVASVELAHGERPADALARAGWEAVRPLSATSPTGASGRSSDEGRSSSGRGGGGGGGGAGARWTVRLAYLVRPSSSPQVPPPGPLLCDDGLSDADVARAVVRRRVAAYGLIGSERGLLLTELSARTNVPGRWNLPGGGLDPGEGVEAGLRREVWEESGQQVEDIRLVDVVSDHWVGRAPHGVVEDYHAVRLIHTAHCPAPSDPVIHDIGGSTSDVRWFALDEIDRVPLVDSVAPLVRDAVRRHPAGFGGPSPAGPVTEE